MHMLEKDYSLNYIHVHYGIHKGLLTVFWRKYQIEGEAGLRKEKSIRANGLLKKEIVKNIEEKHLPLTEASLKYGASVGRISFWLKTARSKGLDALDAIRQRGRPRKMGIQKKKAPQTELQRLQEENLKLKIENELLKKVKALVKTREARLHKIGHKPSKN